MITPERKAEVLLTYGADFDLSRAVAIAIDSCSLQEVDLLIDWSISTEPNSKWGKWISRLSNKISYGGHDDSRLPCIELLFTKLDLAYSSGLIGPELYSDRSLIPLSSTALWFGPVDQEATDEQYYTLCPKMIRFEAVRTLINYLYHPVISKDRSDRFIFLTDLIKNDEDSLHQVSTYILSNFKTEVTHKYLTLLRKSVPEKIQLVPPNGNGLKRPSVSILSAISIHEMGLFKIMDDVPLDLCQYYRNIPLGSFEADFCNEWLRRSTPYIIQDGTEIDMLLEAARADVSPSSLSLLIDLLLNRGMEYVDEVTNTNEKGLDDLFLSLVLFNSSLDKFKLVLKLCRRPRPISILLSGLIKLRGGAVVENFYDEKTNLLIDHIIWLGEKVRYHSLLMAITIERFSKSTDHYISNSLIKYPFYESDVEGVHIDYSDLCKQMRSINTIYQNFQILRHLSSTHGRTIVDSVHPEWFESFEVPVIPMSGNTRPTFADCHNALQ